MPFYPATLLSNLLLLCELPCALQLTHHCPQGQRQKCQPCNQTINLQSNPNTTPYGGSEGLARTVCNALRPPQATSEMKTTRASHILPIRRFVSGTWHRSAKSAFSISDHADVFTANCPAIRNILRKWPFVDRSSQLASGKSAPTWATHKPTSLTQPSGQSAPKS